MKNDVGFDFNFWEEAIKLLDKQLELKQDNKHFAKLNMFYYEYVKSNYDEKKYSKDYYNLVIKTGYIYSLEEHFFNKNYYIRKDKFRLRKISFTSYFARLYHYMIGLYLLKLTNDFHNNYYLKNKNIRSYYGGNLKYNNDNNLILKQENIYYRPQYQKFKKNIKSKIKTSKQAKFIISMDVQDFYDNIDISILTDLIEKSVKFSQKEKYNYNEQTINSIINFYKLLSSGKTGIPQGDNDIISSFISNLYMCFFDLDVDDILKTKGISNYKIIRYVDDIYISIEFDEHLSEDNKKINNILIDIIDKCTNKLNKKYNLKFNEKSAIFDLSKPEDIEKIKEKIKKISLIDYYETKNIDPNVALEKIFVVLKNIGESLPIDKEYEKSKKEYSEILKQIYSPMVRKLLKKEENQKRLINNFSTIDVQMMRDNIPELVTIACLIDALKEILKEKIIKLINKGYDNKELIIEFLAKTNMENQHDFVNILNDVELKEIINFELTSNQNIYYPISPEFMIKIENNNKIINQIINRRINEKMGNWNIAINHLVNEFHAICFHIYINFEHKQIKYKDFNLEKIKELLILNKVNNELAIEIINLFDRRNNNGLSHLNGINVEALEYEKYKKAINQCLKKLSNNYSKL